MFFIKLINLGFITIVSGYYLFNNNHLLIAKNNIKLNLKKENNNNKIVNLYKPKTDNQSKYVLYEYRTYVRKIKKGIPRV